MRRWVLGSVGLALATVVIASSASYAAQESGPGKALFDKRCGGCHALDRDKEGPRLGGVYGRVAGSVATFQYSDALKRSKITWTEETLNKWLMNTETLVPDNDMSFRVPDAVERSEIIAYLKQNSAK